MSASSIPVAELLCHASWVQSLARALARDESTAQDLVQDAWLAVFRRPPAHGANLRGFLGVVVRNLWRMRHRRDALRGAAEAAVAGVDRATGPATCDVVARVASQRVVVDAVMALPEPYCSTVLLRFFDGWSVPRIAAHQRVPVATVRTRLQRALSRLRERLATSDGRGLAALLVPLLRPGRPSLVWPLLPLLAMKTKLLVGLGAAAIVGLVVVSKDLAAVPIRRRRPTREALAARA